MKAKCLITQLVDDIFLIYFRSSFNPIFGMLWFGGLEFQSKNILIWPLDMQRYFFCVNLPQKSVLLKTLFT